MRIAIVLSVACTVAALAAPAHANCARSPGYDIEVDGNTVVIHPYNHYDMQCGGAVRLLREHVETGEIVALPDRCEEEAPMFADAPGYVDECVPHGTYRYGFEQPYSCEFVGCSFVPFFGDARVIGSPEDECVPAQATVQVDDVPWEDDPVACSTSGCSMAPGTGASGGAAAVLALGLGLALTARRRGRPA